MWRPAGHTPPLALVRSDRGRTGPAPFGFDTPHEALAAACRSRFPKKQGCTRCWRPADHTAGFVADIRAAATHEPVLLADLDGRAHGGDDGRD
ncbi:hypothetical protein, partial [Kitasatospora sp. NPDC085879]|uniref:hypothetical protein n=1 Tax=Kitasatospora sp. NPDC085879 TaxID=3154769 RepID=UPI00343E0183